jgi:AAA+ lid domain
MPTAFTLPPHVARTSGTDTKKESGAFDWHSSRPVESAAVLDRKLGEFKFSSAAVGGGGSDEGQSKGKEVEFRDHLEGYDLLYELLRLTEGFSGAEVVSAVQEAGMLAIDEGEDTLLVSHLLSAVLAVKPQITPEVLSFYGKIAATY